MSAAAAFFFFPIVGAASGALKQRIVPHVLQGRVFAADQLLQTAGIALGILVAGPLADQIFEPAFSLPDSWANGLSWLVGSEPRSGMALLVLLAGIGGVATGLLSLFARSIRTIEVYR
jgi:hypothetical protein